jgi:hypothetical protein
MPCRTNPEPSSSDMVNAIDFKCYYYATV